MENAEITTRTPEEREAALKDAFSRVRLHVTENSGTEGKGSVLDRLSEVANRQSENDAEKGNVASATAGAFVKEGLDGLTEAMKENNEKRNDPALKTPENEETAEKGKEKGLERGLERNSEERGKEENPLAPREKDGKDKDGKDKDGKENEAKRDEQKREALSKVKLPSGVEIKQEGPSWVLVSNDGRQRTDVTEVMEAIDKYNRGVDATNEESRVQNEAQTGVENVAQKEGAANPLTKDERAQTVAANLPEVKDVNGNQVFKPEDMEAFAKFALSVSDAELKALEGKGLSEELGDKKKKNNEQEEEGLRRRQELAARGVDR